MFDPLYDPRTPEKKPEYISVADVPGIAKRAAYSKFPLSDFKKIYQSAIDQGMTSEQKIGDVVGRDGLEILRSQKSNPSPALCRLVLKFLATLNPESATMKKEPWRHANQRPKEERALQTQPL